MEAGDLAGALTAFRGAHKAILDEGREGRRPPDRELADYLALHLYNLGVRFNNQGDADSALDSFIEALHLGGKVPRLRDGTFRANLREAALQVAGFLVASSRPDRPLAAYQLIQSEEPTSSRVLLALGAAHLARGELDQAALVFEKVESIYPGSAEGAAGRGRVALARARGRTGADAVELLRSAAGLLRGAAEMEPGSPARLRELGAVEAQLSLASARAGEAALAAASRSGAEAAYERAIALEPDSPWLRLDLANFMSQTRRYEEAVAQYAQADRALASLLEARPSDRNATAWKSARVSARNSIAVASYNLAVDAVNRAQFSSAEGHLSRACGAGPAWAETCRAFREVMRSRQESFSRVVASHEQALASDAGRAESLLALGDLYSLVGAYDKALEYYRRINSGAASLEDRIAANIDPGRPAELRKTVELRGARAEMRYFREPLGPDLEAALKASWLRVASSLGEESLRGELLVTVYPNRRAFRESAGYRVGGMVKGHYIAGHLSVFATPTHTVLEWVSVLTHELTHHAVERISSGAAPRWLSEGIARYVEGDSTAIDRDRVKRRLESSVFYPLSSLDDVMDRSWNDPEVILDARDQSLLAVEEIVRRRGMAGVKEILTSIAGRPGEPEASLRRAVGAGLEEIDRSWQSKVTNRAVPQ